MRPNLSWRSPLRPKCCIERGGGGGKERRPAPPLALTPRRPGARSDFPAGPSRPASRKRQGLQYPVSRNPRAVSRRLGSSSRRPRSASSPAVPRIAATSFGQGVPWLAASTTGPRARRSGKPGNRRSGWSAGGAPRRRRRHSAYFTGSRSFNGRGSRAQPHTSATTAPRAKTSTAAPKASAPKRTSGAR